MNLFLLVGSYAQPSEPGISLFSFDTENVQSSLLHETKDIKNPSYFVLSNDEKYLYSVSETVDEQSGVFAFAFNKKEREISLLNKQVTEGLAPCYIWVDKKSRIVVTANYRGGNVNVFPVCENGHLSPLSTIFTYEGSSVDPLRQDKPHIHCVYSSPDEKFLYVNDLGTDRIYRYDIVCNPDIILRECYPRSILLSSGEGPRHTVFHPNGKCAYLIGELSGNVTVLNYIDGDLVSVQSVEADSLHAGGSADIHVSPDGRFLYVSNRLAGDGIAILGINQGNGTLSKIGYFFTKRHPRNFVITPDGHFILCACRDDNRIQILAVDKASGSLKDTYRDIIVNQPVCLKFATWV